MGFLSDTKKIYTTTLFSNLLFVTDITIPFYLLWGGISYAEIFILQAFYAICSFALEVPTGVVADKYGRKVSISLGMFCGAASYAVMGSYPHLAVFFIAKFLAAMGLAFISGADKALMYETVKKDKFKKSYSRMLSMVKAGYMIGSPVGSTLAALMILPSPNNLWIPVMIGIIPQAAGGLLILTVKEKQVKHRYTPYLKIVRLGLRKLMNNRPLKMIAAERVMSRTIIECSFLLFQAVYIKTGLFLGAYGFMSTAYNLTSIITLWKMDWIERKVGSPRRMLYLCVIIPGICLAALGQVPTMLLGMPLLMIMIGFSGMRFPIYEHAMNKYISNAERATIGSAIAMFNSIATAILSFIVGITMVRSLEWTMLFMGAGMVTIGLTSRITPPMLE